LRTSRLLRTLLTGALVVAIAGCTTTPTEPPTVDLPPATLDELHLERWWTRFDDPALTALVDEALANSLDLRAAMARVDQARAAVTATQGDLYPRVDVGVNAARSRVSQVGATPLPSGFSPIGSDYRVGLNASYEIDLWGKYRAATKAAQNDLLASQYARETVRTTVAAEVARAYFALLTADAQLRLLRDTLNLREETVRLQTDRAQAGIIGEYDLSQAKAERAAVISDIAVTERLIAQNESALAVLTGRSPREVFTPKLVRTASEVTLLNVPDVPAGLPARMLERRPDVRQVEKQIAAASLRIDRANADYFPSIALTGAVGSESAALHDLFSGPAFVWSIGAGLLQPLFNLKNIEANVQVQTGRREELAAIYEQTVQSAFRDAHDALVANRTTRDALAAQKERADNLRQAYELSDVRYKAGYSPYLEVLDAQRQLLQAQTLQILAARDVRFALIDLAKALGGGWEYESAVEPAATAAAKPQ
jgi:multidrug efflux system outer membrane protein